MYVIDMTHYLDTKGAIAPERGPARKMADFLTAVVVHASDIDRPDDMPGPACGNEGRIANWQRTFWDLSQGTPSN